jgi:hypothetical protein
MKDGHYPARLYKRGNTSKNLERKDGAVFRWVGLLKNWKAE